VPNKKDSCDGLTKIVRLSDDVLIAVYRGAPMHLEPNQVAAIEEEFDRMGRILNHDETMAIIESTPPEEDDDSEEDEPVDADWDDEEE